MVLLHINKDKEHHFTQFQQYTQTNTNTHLICVFYVQTQSSLTYPLNDAGKHNQNQCEKGKIEILRENFYCIEHEYYCKV